MVGSSHSDFVFFKADLKLAVYTSSVVNQALTLTSPYCIDLIVVTTIGRPASRPPYKF